MGRFFRALVLVFVAAFSLASLGIAAGCASRDVDDLGVEEEEGLGVFDDAGAVNDGGLGDRRP